MKRIAAFLVGLALMLAPASAIAQSSTCQAYNPQLCNVSSSEGTTSAGTEGSGVASSGTLPFTGLDIGLLAVCGGVLVAGGGVVRSRLKRLD
jgi:hypothetical protein